MAKQIKIALIQPQITYNNEKNQNQISNLIKQAVLKKPDIICLPERWYHIDFPLLINSDGSIKLKNERENIFQPKQGEQYHLVQAWARKFHTPIISGGIWEKNPSDQNAIINCYYFDAEGNEKFSQNKIHLYGIEKKLASPGKNLVIFHDKQLNFKFSILICFDLHISSYLLSQAVSHGAEMIFSPTLIREDGINNWKIYLQARALEYRIPIASCNSVYEAFGRKFIGRSKILTFYKGKASPVHLKLWEMGNQAGELTQTVDLEFPNSIRQERVRERLDNNKIEIMDLN
ncbi:MAG: hypothetical protein DRO88_03995 [Promethearchaeia archaeon]|nr:MAG: hypothetical protein DRO88_03995 [Candidatus Lokiarchaeia archaeon]